MPRRVSFSKNIDKDHRQIFNHIANFENYSSYIPGCTNAKLNQKEDEYEVGEHEFNFLLRNYSIKSKNFLLGNTILIFSVAFSLLILSSMPILILALLSNKIFKTIIQ